MRRQSTAYCAVTALLLLALAGCARGGPGDGGGNAIDDRGNAGPAAPASGAADPAVREAFNQRAAAIAAAYRGRPAGGVWRTGFVPLGELTIAPPDGFPDGKSKSAFLAGRFADGVGLPTAVPGPGTIRFPDGSTLNAPLVSARDAYGALDKGDAPCPGVPKGAPVNNECGELRISGASLGEAKVRTSRGEAIVPAWLFTIDGLKQPVARVAVDPSAVQAPPTIPPVSPEPVRGIVGVEGVTALDGRQLGYQLGVGACDYDIAPLVHETDDVVVIGGSVRTRPGACVLMLKMQPVTVELARDLGARAVVNIRAGELLPVPR